MSFPLSRLSDSFSSFSRFGTLGDVCFTVLSNYCCLLQIFRSLFVFFCFIPQFRQCLVINILIYVYFSVHIYLPLISSFIFPPCLLMNSIFFLLSVSLHCCVVSPNAPRLFVSTPISSCFIPLHCSFLRFYPLLFPTFSFSLVNLLPFHCTTMTGLSVFPTSCSHCPLSAFRLGRQTGRQAPE